MRPIKRALLSVSDRAGLLEFARGLLAAGVELLSTGGTAGILREAGMPVTEVSDYTGFPEIMGGRVKTLHPKIHGALLGRSGTDDVVMREHGIAPIGLLAVNLYPFESTIAEAGHGLEQAIDNIDVGGPAMLRAAAKNYPNVAVVVDNGDYSRVLADMQAHQGAVSDTLRFQLAAKAFARCAAYDGAIAGYLSGRQADGKYTHFPDYYTPQFHKLRDLRYGENPHQQAALYSSDADLSGTLAGARQIQGKQLSYNNLADADAALACVQVFAAPACVIVKHANPCGVALGKSLLPAYQHAYATDPGSAFGGVLAFNRELDAETATEILKRQFVEVIVAPFAAQAAIQELANKPNVRVLVTGALKTIADALDYQSISGGLLLQETDRENLEAQQLKTASHRSASAAELPDLLFAWQVVNFVKSNAIVFAKDCRTIGIGAGQPSRVMSAQIAALKAQDAKLALRGAVMASDAFLPFRDSVDAAYAAGISAIIQPGGSMRDAEVIAAADEHGMAMLFTGIRHFRH
jgi:phosphoribosylaminoimidazolecarboxamide formyltransferase / IMP cyclohydrolase